jgi:hypothetical protein
MVTKLLVVKIELRIREKGSGNLLSSFGSGTPLRTQFDQPSPVSKIFSRKVPISTVKEEAARAVKGPGFKASRSG